MHALLFTEIPLRRILGNTYFLSNQNPYFTNTPPDLI